MGSSGVDEMGVVESAIGLSFQVDEPPVDDRPCLVWRGDSERSHVADYAMVL